MLKKKATRGAKGVFQCEACGKDFEARIADRKRGWARYCSRECQVSQLGKVRKAQIEQNAQKGGTGDLERRISELENVARSALRWIDAVPKEVRASLPAMPGFCRDWADSVLSGIFEEDLP